MAQRTKESQSQQPAALPSILPRRAVVEDKRAAPRGIHAANRGRHKACVVAKRKRTGGGREGEECVRRW